VRLLTNRDYDALCPVLGHKGASATMPCLVCLSTRSPSREHHALDCKYLTLQDVTGTRTVRSEQQYDGGGQAGQSVVGDATGTPSERQLAHMSMELAPLLPAVPQQIVPIPLHITLGINSRLLSLATECVIRCKGKATGLRFAHRLAAALRSKVGVTPVPYHGGGFIGRDCHGIGDRSDAICRLMLMELSEE